MRLRTYSAAAAAAGLLAVATPVAGASVPPPAFTFVPPRVGQLSVDIGPTIINGKVVDPGLHVVSPGVSLPPITWPPPSTGDKSHKSHE
jgi:hypothetical protein